MREVVVKRLESELTAEEKVELAETNHIWVNAFACIRPTDEFCLDVGREVVRLLNESPIRGDLLGVEVGSVLYLRVNKS